MALQQITLQYVGLVIRAPKEEVTETARKKSRPSGPTTAGLHQWDYLIARQPRAREETEERTTEHLKQQLGPHDLMIGTPFQAWFVEQIHGRCSITSSHDCSE